MRFEQLRYFVEVANTTSIIAASKYLFTTPQNISKAIIQLEKELNAKLFHRVKSGMFLTDEGLTAYKSAQTILKEQNLLQNMFSDECSRLPVIEETIQLDLLYPEWFGKIAVTILNQMVYNGMQISHVRATSKAILELNIFLRDHLDMVHHKFDLIILSLDEKDMESYKKLLQGHFAGYLLWEDIFCLEVSTTDPLAKLEEIPISVLESLPIVTYTSDAYIETHIERAFQSRGIKLNIIYRIPSDIGKAWGIRQNVYSIIGSPSCEWFPNLGHICIPIEGNYHTEHLVLIPSDKQELPQVKMFVMLLEGMFEMKKLF